MAKKTIYKTVIQIEFLSDEPLNDNDNLDDLIYRAYQGDLSSKESTVLLNRPLNGRQAVNAIKNQGSDTEFFGIDSRGEEID